ncbi:hypothetical protein [Brevibacillus marinus]|uniref:hypothetical protein n=1 Tax=Brevibacillus marinus TaxID=2496837 RepID=UPI000F81CAEA|nr:hypothetical protein [Brevibacillus marinus]
MSDGTKLVVFLEQDLNKREENLVEALKHAEMTKMLLAEQLMETRAWKLEMAIPTLNSTMIESYDETDYYVRFVMNGTLPMIYDRLDAKYHRKVRDFYVNQFVHFVRKNEIQRKFSPAFVFIAQYFPNSTIRDLDNRAKTFIFNGLRYSQITEDDNWQNISYMEKGFLDRENPRTEIWVCHEEDTVRLIQEIKVKTEG